MIEIRFHSTGGQGAVTGVKLLVNAIVASGYQAQSFSSYGGNRRGGKVESYLRISEEPILAHSSIYEPDYLIIMDEELAERPEQVVSDIKEGGGVLINSPYHPSHYSFSRSITVTTLDANAIAIEKGLRLPSGAIIINTTMMGAVLGMFPTIDIDNLAKAIEEARIPSPVKNIEAAREAHLIVKGGISRPIIVTNIVAEAARVSENYAVYQTKTSPCEASCPAGGCPAGENIPQTAFYIQYGHFEDALESIKAENPFPGICGRVCFHPCETSCNRTQFVEGLAINALERATFDYADSKKVKKPAKRPSTGKKVAIIGSGPAGMTGAYYLSLLGHRVTLFEAQPVAGGVPRLAIPGYRLPKAIVDREVKEIASLGVDIKVNTKVGKDIAFNTITKEYDACFIAAGAHRSMKLDIPGEDITGVLSGLDFLKRSTSGEKVDIGAKVAVIGGGNTAVDTARTAKRLGASKVTIIYRRSSEEMPAHKPEVEAAEKEGIKVHYLATPVQIHSDGNRIRRLECVKTKLGEKDEDGRRRAEPIEGSNFMVDVDTVFTALGETLELPFPDGTVKMSGPVIEVDELGRTSLAGVYAGGDVASLSRSVVEAIASGKRAALGIDLYLTGADKKLAASYRKGENGAISMGCYLTGESHGESNHIVAYEDLNVAYFTKEPRTVAAELPVKTRIKDFSEINLGFTKEGAIAEAERCFHCGHCALCENCFIFCSDLAIKYNDELRNFTIDTSRCKGCGVCVEECPSNAIILKGENQ